MGGGGRFLRKFAAAGQRPLALPAALRLPRDPGPSGGGNSDSRDRTAVRTIRPRGVLSENHIRT
jgi:hypothetical protein